MKKLRTSLAEALSRTHAVLRDDLRKLKDAARLPGKQRPADMKALLVETRARVAEHFRFEEQNGYMDAVRKREPRLERTVLHLAEEHRQLAQALDALVQEAETAVGPDSGFDERIRAWVDRLRQHEARENELFQNAFNLDIGAED